MCPADSNHGSDLRIPRTSRSVLPSGALIVFSVPSFSSLNVTLMLQGGVSRGQGRARREPCLH